MPAPALGSVDSFDPATGLGRVALDDGRLLSFHATAIADGSRRIEVGRRVAVEVLAGHGGRFEADSLRPI